MKYSQFTNEEPNEPKLVKSETQTGPITALFNQRWGVADFADLDLSLKLSPMEKTLSLPGYGIKREGKRYKKLADQSNRVLQWQQITIMTMKFK